MLVWQYGFVLSAGAFWYKQMFGLYVFIIMHMTLLLFLINILSVLISTFFKKNETFCREESD